MTNDEACQVIEAFVDGEVVNAPALTNALSAPDAREHLIDVLVLRGFVGSHAAVKPVVAPAPRPRTSRAGWMSLMAAAIVSGLLGGYAIGRRVVSQPIIAAPSTAVANETPGDVSTKPPRPTRVIQLRDGVDWHERGGG